MVRSIYICGSFVVLSSAHVDARPGPGELRAEELLSDDGALKAGSEGPEVGFLRSVFLPIDSPEAEVHEPGVEVESLSYLHQ